MKHEPPIGPVPRVLGVTVVNVSDWRETRPAGKWAQFFAALARRYQIVDIVQTDPSFPASQRYLNLARNIRPTKARWLAQAGMNQSLERRRTDVVQRELNRLGGAIDGIILHQTLCRPGIDRGGRPFAIYTDNTMALTQRLYPPPGAEARRAARHWVAYEAGICTSAEVVFTCSEWARTSMVEDYGCQPERVVSVGGGANQADEIYVDRNHDRPVALFVGMQFERKGGRVLLDAWPRVRAAIPEAELVIIGPKRAPARPLPDGVRWLGRLDREALAHAYRSAALFVMPSLFEPFGLVFLEAMGYGLPCVGSDCCAMPELIRDGESGRIVQRGEPEPLADALIELLGDPQGLAVMGRRAHELVRESGSWDHVAERVATHFWPTTKVSG